VPTRASSVLVELLASGKVGRFLRAYAAARRHGSAGKRDFLRALKRVLPRGLARALARPRKVAGHPAMAGLINPAFAGAGEIMRRMDRYLTQGPANSVQNRVQMIRRVDPGTYMKAVQLKWNIELRDPALDRRLVEFCLQVPLENFFHDGRPRALARTALRGRAPESVLADIRRGLQAPHWFAMLSASRDEASRILAQIASFGTAARLLDVDKMRELLRDWPDELGFGPPIYRYGFLRGLVMAEFIRINSLL
jgi:hypothetical protein